jgi:hypothetical protein
MSGDQERLAEVTPLRPRRVHPLTGRLAFVVVAAAVCASLGAVSLGHFRVGVVGLALSVLGAAVLRAVLPERYTGWLAVRARWVDVTVLGALGSALLVFALIVPPPV